MFGDFGLILIKKTKGDFGLGLRILHFGGLINCGQPDPYPVLGLKISDKPHLKIKLCFFSFPFFFQMGSMSLTSILGNGCRSLSAPVALVRTLALTRVALSEHSSNYRHVKVAWFSQRSKKKRVACESLKEEITHPTVASSVYG